MRQSLLNVYAVKHKEFDIRMASRSGGVFTALSDEVLHRGGIVYGCVLNEQFEAVHVRAETAGERNKMRGSKYIQSNMGDIFTQVKQDLQNGRKVLFSGTSCQVAGLKAFLQKDYSEQLLCVDILCHGVPSPLIWKKYLNWQEQKNNGKIISVNFRNKKDFGWRAHVETLTMQDPDGNTFSLNSEVFKELFYGHRALRPCCYRCPYKDIVHPADITIADYWGIDQASPGFNDNKGVSLVLINNFAGDRFFENIRDCLEVRECRIEDSMQPPLKAPFDRPSDRETFWKDVEKQEFDYIVKKYRAKTFMTRVKKKVKRVLKKLNSR